jgi:hypothetical protein
MIGRCGCSYAARRPLSTERHELGAVVDGDAPAIRAGRPIARPADSVTVAASPQRPSAGLAGVRRPTSCSQRLHALLAVASISRSADTGRSGLEAEKRLGAVIGQAFHQACALAPVALTSVV